MSILFFYISGEERIKFHKASCDKLLLRVPEEEQSRPYVRCDGGRNGLPGLIALAAV
jgi:hypothetical protein